MLQDDRLKLLHNPLIAYLNINSLRNKVIDYMVISETKLDESFPNSQFKLNGYEVRAIRDRHKHGGGLIEFVRQGFICKRLKKYEPNYSECICNLQFQRKSGSVLAYIGLHQRETLKHSLKK